jgi:hypothetical protein
VFENKFVRRISLYLRRIKKRERWKLYNEELHNLYSSPNIIRQIKIKENEVGRACGMHGRGEETVHAFGSKAKRKETT